MDITPHRERRRFAAIAVVSAALTSLALLAAISANAQTPVASCPRDADIDQFSNLGPGGGAEAAQTFMVASDAIVQAVQLELIRFVSGTGNFVVGLHTADGTGPIGAPLATGTFPVADAPTTAPGALPTIGLSPSALMVPGQLYAIAVSISGTGEGGVRIRNDNSPCSGQRFFRVSSSAAWAATPTADFSPYAVLGSPPPPQPEPDTNAPGATITDGPKNKTKKKTATFTFTGTDTRAVAGFQCSLDGAAFSACTSPHTVKVKKGKHNFKVRAVDDAGNVGTPASDDWKRKKKRR